jgi:hypothetical protein
VFLGYPSNYRGYKCLDMTTNKTIICRHVLFDESVFPYAKLHTPQSTTYNFLDNELSPYLNQPYYDLRPNQLYIKSIDPFFHSNHFS